MLHELTEFISKHWIHATTATTRPLFLQMEYYIDIIWEMTPYCPNQLLKCSIWMLRNKLYLSKYGDNEKNNTNTVPGVSSVEQNYIYMFKYFKYVCTLSYNPNH